MSFKSWISTQNPRITTTNTPIDPWAPGKKVKYQITDLGIGTITTFEDAKTKWGQSLANAFGDETVWAYWTNAHDSRPLQIPRKRLIPLRT